MGLNPLRRIGTSALALVLLAAAACTDDRGASDGADRPGPTTTEAATTAPAPAPADRTIGGSRYLAYTVRTPDGTFEVVREDLVDGTTDVVDRGAEPRGEVDVSADGAIAWERVEPDDAYSTWILLPDASEPVRVDGADVGCPGWRRDGSLLVLRLADDGTAVPVIVDPRTGAVTRELTITLDPAVCVVPDGLDHLVVPRPLDREPYGPNGAEIVRMTLDGHVEDFVGHIPAWCWANDLDVAPAGDALAAGVYCDARAPAERIGLYVGTMADDLHPLVAENTHTTTREQAYQYWSPTWSADGRLVAYHRSQSTATGDSPHVWIVDTGDGVPVDRGPSRSAEPSLSPPVGSGRD